MGGASSRGWLKTSWLGTPAAARAHTDLSPYLCLAAPCWSADGRALLIGRSPDQEKNRQEGLRAGDQILGKDSSLCHREEEEGKAGRRGRNEEEGRKERSTGWKVGGRKERDGERRDEWEGDEAEGARGEGGMRREGGRKEAKGGKREESKREGGRNEKEREE